MTLRIKQPNLILGLFTFLLLIVAIGFRANKFNTTAIVIFLMATLLGAIHWVWSMVDVFKDYRTNKKTENRRIVWVILVLIVPPLGGIIYYLFNKNLTA